MIFISLLVKILLIIIIYFVLDLLFDINYKKVKQFIKKGLNKLNYLENLENSLKYINKIYLFNGLLINKYSIFILSMFFSIISFFLVISKLNLLIYSVFISIIVFFIPKLFIDFIKLKVKLKIKQSFFLYVIGLQNFSVNSNDVIMAINSANSVKPLNIFTDKFIILVKNGFDVLKAFNMLIDEINIKDVSKFFNLLKLSYINGGNLNLVIKQYSEYLDQIKIINKFHKEKRNYYISILVLILLINIFLISIVILKNEQYREIMLNSFFGKLILDINACIYFFILLIIMKVLKMEE